MLTPQEVANRELEKAVFGGYDIRSVDRFLDELSRDYADLYRDNGILKGKLKTLADRVEAYRTSEDGIQSALVGAEKAAKEIIAAAQRQAQELDGETEKRRSELLRGVEAEVEAYRQKLRSETAAEEQALERAKARTAAFLAQASAAAQEHQAALQRLRGLLPAEETPAPAGEAQLCEAEGTEAPEPAAQPEEGEMPHGEASMGSIAELINRSYQNPAPESEPERFDFQDVLQFGSNYKPGKK